MHEEARQAAQGSIREIVEAAQSSSHGEGILRDLRRREARWLVRFGVREKEVARNVASGTRRCLSTERAPNPKHGGLISMPQAPGSLSVQQKNSLESAYSCFRGVRAFLESTAAKIQPDEQ